LLPAVLVFGEGCVVDFDHQMALHLNDRLERTIWLAGLDRLEENRPE